MNRTIVSFLISFILLIIVIALNRFTYEKRENFSREAEHSREVIKSYSQLSLQLRSAEMFSPSYLTSHASDLYTIYQKDIDSVESNLANLRNLIDDNPEQVTIVDSIGLLLKNQLPTLRQKNIPEILQANEAYRINEIIMIHSLIDKGLEEEESLLLEKKNELFSFTRQNNILSLLLATFAIIIISFTFFSHLFIKKKKIWLEGFLESILNTSQNGIMYYKTVRKNGTITDFKVDFANQAILPLLGMDPKKIIGKRLTELDPYVSKTDLFSIYIKAAESGEPVQLEHLYTAIHNEKWLYLSISKMNDGITVAFHDISDLKRYENELKKNITALEQSNTELEEYAYAASHDLQEPLRKLRTFGGFLHDNQKDRLDEKGRQQLDKMLQAAERMTLLIKDLLSFSSLKQKEVFEPTSLDQILENVLHDLEVLIEQTGAIITHDPLPEIEAIPVQMNQLFYNMVNNSLKFAKQEIPLRLDISSRLLPEEDARTIAQLKPGITYYELIFSDNGIGFNPDYAGQIFGMFKRLNDRTHYAGSGIGLALCKKVVINHDGYIEATGKEGIGAQFYIYLPQTQKKH